MNALTKIEVNDIHKIMANFETLPIELKGVVIEQIKRISEQIYEYKKKAEYLIIKEMETDGATKAPFIDADGNERMITLTSGKVECKTKNIDELYEEAGFIAQEIGDYVFKPSWSKAKEALKMGGEKKKFIEQHFVNGNKTIKISEVEK